MPAHCVPQTIVFVETFPRKAEGKIDRTQLHCFAWEFQSEELASPNVAQHDLEAEVPDDYFVDFVAPRNETEQTLADIWQDVLGMSEISVDDDFLEVGGDSLLSIRIIARANKAGLSISPQDFFELPTIAQQADHVAQSNAVILVSEQNLSGKFNLAPIQHWFFERITDHQHHWHQNVSLKLPKTYTFGMLENAFEALLLHHDVLRSQFFARDGNWQQEILPLSPLLPIQVKDLRECATTNITEELIKITDQMQAEMSLSACSLIQFLFVQMPEGDDNKLVIIAHHLIIDAESWRILLEDLNLCLEASFKHQVPVLGHKTHSVKLWSERLEQLAKEPEWQNQLLYWQQQLQDVECSFPVDSESSNADNLSGSQQVFSQVFSVQQTQTILDQLQKQEVSIQNGLIDALVTALWQWSKLIDLVIDIEIHGREALFADLDLSRSIGWFTAYYPLVFSQPTQRNQWSTNIATKLANVPNNGIAYGILRELYRDDTLRNQQAAKVCFNFLGQLDKLSGTAQNNGLKVETFNIGTPRSPQAPRSHLLEINAMISEQKLVINWVYNEELHQQSSLVEIGELFAQALNNEIVSMAALSETESVNTFELSDLDNEDMNKLADILSQLDD
jgi:non-ribosomal peptide synthase protein (TIGR01720 family)